ncbi:hypothetical protein BaRGS_00001218 [Batillaria attramentaria]|uniref:Defective in cullin neddylation protein n=1 Tax=Batillaria attramentaria TaxID=370345 RepID=A0ABD0M717_9CAEN
MGKCLSCCEKPVPPGSSHPTASHPLHTLPLHRPYTALPQDSKEAAKLQQQALVQQSPPGPTDSLLGSGGPTPAEKKMFTPYPKLPPIKRQTNGEGKRPSFTVGMGGGGGLGGGREVSEAKMVALFEQYKDEDEDAMLADGIERFCSDLGVQPDEFIVLLIAWKCEAATMCCFTRSEFLHGCHAMHVDSVKGLQARFPELKAEVRSRPQFKEMYRWTYKFGLDHESGQRTLPLEMAIGLWRLVFSQSQPPVLERWLSFLEKHMNIRGIPKDTWDMFLNFTEQVGDDLSSYDDTEAWPSLLDDFVEFENDRQNQNVKTD